MVRPVENYANVDYVLKTLTRKIRRLPEVESVGIKAAYGRVAAKDIAARVNIPEFTTSHMDGFAIISDNVKSATVSQPVSLRVKGEVNLGAIPRISVRLGETVRVATGSRVPEGADAVVPVEDVEERGKTIAVKSSLEAGSFIYQEGEDLRLGKRWLQEQIELPSSAFFGFAIGMVAGSVGVAGGEYRIPVLTYLFGMQIKVAGTASQLVSIPTLIAAAAKYAKQRAIRQNSLKIALILGAPFLVGVALSNFIILAASNALVKLIFGSIITYTMARLTIDLVTKNEE